MFICYHIFHKNKRNPWVILTVIQLQAKPTVALISVLCLVLVRTVHWNLSRTICHLGNTLFFLSHHACEWTYMKANSDVFIHRSLHEKHPDVDRRCWRHSVVWFLSHPVMVGPSCSSEDRWAVIKGTQLKSAAHLCGRLPGLYPRSEICV